jgi:hypothetical protein
MNKEQTWEAIMLTREQYEAKWPEIKTGVRNLWGHLTEREIEESKEELFALSDIIEDRYNESKEEIHSKLNHLMDSFDNDTDKNLLPDTSSFMRSPIGAPEKENINILASQGSTVDESPHTPDRKRPGATSKPQTRYNNFRSGFGVGTGEADAQDETLHDRS